MVVDGTNVDVAVGAGIRAFFYLEAASSLPFLFLFCFGGRTASACSNDEGDGDDDGPSSTDHPERDGRRFRRIIMREDRDDSSP